MSEEPGWYPDPYFLGRERRWDGHAWTEDCRSAATKEAQPSAKPRAPKNPEAATPSATAAKAAAKSAAAGDAAAPEPAPKADATPAPTSATPTPTPPPAAAAPAPALPSVVAASAAAAAAATSAATSAGDAKEPPATMEVPAVRAEPSTQKVEPAAPVAAAPAPPPDAPPLATKAEVPAATKAEVPSTTKEDAESLITPVSTELADSEEGDRDEPKTGGKDHEETPSRRRRRFLVGAVAAVVLVIVVVVVAVVSKGSGRGTSGGTLVARAASATVGQRYAAVDVGVKVQSGTKAAASGISGFSASGTFDLASNLGSMTLIGSGNAGGEAMVLDNQTIYLDPGALVGQLVKGKVWVSATPDDLGAASSPSGFAVAPTLFMQLAGSPTTLLQQLKANGVTATALGASIYQGTPVEEYNVTLSQQAINLRLQALPSSLRGDVLNSPEHVFLTTNGLVRAISVPIAVENNGAQATGHVVVGFTSWGQVADLSVPPPEQVVSWAQFGAVLTYTSKLG